MKKKTNEGNLYDKIFKENAESIFIPLIESYLGFKIVERKSLPQKIQTTMEREVDYLFEVTLSNSDNFLLHLEFQTKNEKDLLERMAEYHGILYKKYKKRIEHFVIYLGPYNVSVKTKLESSHVFDSFTFINLSQLKPDEFLNSNIPQEILIAILTDIGKEQKEETMRLIIKKLEKHSIDKSNFNKFVNQLWVLSRLRKISELTTKIINEMPLINIDITKDALYNLGMEKGTEKGIEKGIENEKIEVTLRCFKNNFTLKEISMITGLSIYKIKSIIKSKKV